MRRILPILIIGLAITAPIGCESIADTIADKLGEQDPSKVQPVPYKEVLEKKKDAGKPVNSTVIEKVKQFDKKSEIKNNTGTKNPVNDYKIKKVETGQTKTHTSRTDNSGIAIIERVVVKPIKKLFSLIISFIKAPKTAIDKIIKLFGLKKEKPPAEEDEKPSIAIVPGTKWCGPGNNAYNISDVGAFAGTDSCCRQHDNCPKVLEAGASGYGLKNTGVFTRSECKCDEEFYNCLKNVDTTVSSKVGTAYFTVAKPQCFKEVNCKTVKCRNGKTTGTEYQWTDNPTF